MSIDECEAGLTYALRLKNGRIVAAVYMGGGQFANGEESEFVEIIGEIEVR